MASPAEQSVEVLQAVYDARITSYLVVISMTILGYDHLLTIQEEIRLMWTGSWGLFNYLYFWNRYFGLVVMGMNGSRSLRQIESYNICRIFLQLEMVTTSLVLTTVDFALVLRVWILYGKRKGFLYISLALLLVELVSMAVIGTWAVQPLKFIHFGLSGPLMSGCFSLNFPTYYGIPGLVMTFAGFILTVYKCISAIGWDRPIRMPITTLFLRDGVMWFLAAFSVMVVSMVIWSSARPSLSQITAMPAVSAYSIISSRVLLNIKSVLAVVEVTDGTMATSVQLETLRFAVDRDHAPAPNTTGAEHER